MSAALTTVDAVRQRLQKPTGEVAQDAEIGDMILSASVLIAGYTQREFAPSASAARTFEHDGSGVLDLAPYDLQAANTVTVDDTPLAADAYKLRPLPASHGVYTQILLPGGTAQEVTVQGLWGFPSVPADVDHACITTVALWLRRDVSAFSRVFKLDEGNVERPDALPSAVKALLDRYKLVRRG